MRIVILQNKQTGACILETTFSDGERHVDGPYSLAVAKYQACGRARIERVPFFSDAWREAMSMLDD